MKLNKELDLKKYKRFFSFGCSFTNYAWPTWADYIGKNIGEYYNFGASGSGNMLIFQQFIQAHKKYNFTKDDLVIIMWTNTTREDRYIDGEWRRNGNLETQGEGPWKNTDYIIDYRGMFMRDIGFISAVKTILQSLRCDWDFLSMVPLSFDIGIPDKNKFGHAHHIYDLKKFFSDELAAMKPSFYEILDGWDTFEHAKFKEGKYETIDYHPTPIVHKKVINHLYEFKNKNSMVDDYFIKKNEILLNTDWTSAAMLMTGEYNGETKSHSTAQWPVIW